MTRQKEQLLEVIKGLKAHHLATRRCWVRARKTADNPDDWAAVNFYRGELDGLEFALVLLEGLV